MPEISINVNTGTIVGSVYSQIVGISVTDSDLTLEFVYVNPMRNASGQQEGRVVSRVTLPINAALGLSNLINETVNKHIKKRSKKE